MTNEKDVRLMLEGGFVDIMCNVNPYFIPNICYENGKKVLDLWILKAIYGCIELDLLCYDLHTDTLKYLGFVINT